MEKALGPHDKIADKLARRRRAQHPEIRDLADGEKGRRRGSTCGECFMSIGTGKKEGSGMYNGRGKKRRKTE